MNRTTLRLAVAGPAFTLAIGLPVLANTVQPARDLACMQAAVEKRENALIAAVDTRATARKQALAARRDALKAAWTITDRRQRRTAIHKAWRTYRAARDVTRLVFRSARHAAWTRFRTDSRACGPGVAGQEGGNEATDLSL